MSNIISELILKTGLFSGGIKSAQNSLKELHSSVIGTKEIVAGAFAAISSSAVVVGLKKAFDVGNELNNLSNATGSAVKDLMVMKQAFEENGIEAEKVGPSLAKLRKAIVSAASTGDGEAFRKIGVNVKALGNMSAADQMRTIGDAIMRIQNPTERSAYAMQLFGRSGQAMLSMFANSGAMEEAAKMIGNQAQILDDNSAIFHDITIKLNAVGTKLQGFFVGMAAQIAPAIKPLTDAFAKMDFSKMGEQIGDVIAFLVTAFSSGNLSTILGDSVILSFENAINFLEAALVGCVYAFGQLIIEQFRFAMAVFQIATTADFWVGLGDSIMGIAEGFIAFLLDGIALLLEKMKGIPLVGEKIGKGAQAISDEANKIRERGQKNRDAGGDKLSPAIDKIKQNAADSLNRVGDAFQKGYTTAPKVFDTGDRQKEFDQAVDSTNAAITANKAAADKYEQEHKPGQGAPTEDMTEAPKRKLGAAFAQTLFKIGGGGVSVGGGAVDPVLQENRRHTSLLQTIAKNTALKTGGLKTGTLGFA
jgi:hypothetical protein